MLIGPSNRPTRREIYRQLMHDTRKADSRGAYWMHYDETKPEDRRKAKVNRRILAITDIVAGDQPLASHWCAIHKTIRAHFTSRGLIP